MNEQVPPHALARRLLCPALLASAFAAGGAWGGAAAGVDLDGFQPARVVSVATSNELAAALAQAEPGDLVEVADGDYAAPGRRFNIMRGGEADRPVLIRAQNRGRARIVGDGGFGVRNAGHVAIEGFVFAHRDLAQALYVENSPHVRFTRNVVRLHERPETRRDEHRLNWLAVVGEESRFVRIDRNLVENKRNSGVMVAVNGTMGKGPNMRAARHVRIDRNHFRDRVRGDHQHGGVSNFHTMMLGWSGISHDTGFAVVEDNLFENCSGGTEILSIKLPGTTVRRNTFVNCLGYVTLRNTHGSVVEGNWFFNTAGLRDERREGWGGPMGVGGVRVLGENHRVFNNYFEGVNTAVLAHATDIPRRSMSRWEYEQAGVFDQWGGMEEVAYAAIAFNTFVDCDVAMRLGGPRSERTAERDVHQPRDSLVARNLFVHRAGEPAIVFNGDLLRWSWQENVFDGPGAEAWLARALPPCAGRAADARLRRTERGYWAPSEDSPCHDVPPGGFAWAAEDIEGKPRGERRHVGSVQGGAGPPLRGPLRPQDVGPDAD